MFEKAPPVLYKFRRFDSQRRHLSLITQSDIWFACARDFNDPFDIAFEYNLDGVDTDLAVEWARNAVRRHEPHLRPEQREVRTLERVTEIRNNPAYLQRVKAEFVEHNQNTFGICSLSAANTNLLLWAHYSQNHSGFCVGLSVDHLNAISMGFVRKKILLDLHEVKYSDILPKPNFFESMIHLEDTKHIQDFIETKSTDWHYEQEWRLVLWGQVNKCLRIGHESITEVILGCRISLHNREMILDACRQFLPHAIVFQARKKDRQFGLELHPIVVGRGLTDRLG